MSQLSALLSKARATTDNNSQDEQDFIKVQNKRKRFSLLKSKHFLNSVSEPVRPTVTTINLRPTQVRFARATKTKFPQLKLQQFRELPI